MRTILGTFICLSGFASLACAAPESTAPLPTYHLHGYYSIREENAVWQFSDNSPWQVVANEPWIDPKVVKWGYVPLTHNSKHYYCLIDEKPITGSDIHLRRSRDREIRLRQRLAANAQVVRPGSLLTSGWLRSATSASCGEILLGCSSSA
jgi:hypothetical protein